MKLGLFNFQVPLLINVLEYCLPHKNYIEKIKYTFFKIIACVSAFIWLMCYYYTYKIPSVVRRVLNPPCSSDFQTNASNWTQLYVNATDPCKGWYPFNGPNGNLYLGILDYANIFSYSMTVICVGNIIDKFGFRIFIAGGNLLTCIGLALYSLAYWFQVTHFAYFLVSSTVIGLGLGIAHPGIIGSLGSWFVNGTKGFVIGACETGGTLGFILALIIPSLLLNINWGMSYVSGLVLTSMVTIFIYLFLVPTPKYLSNYPNNQSINSLGTYKKINDNTKYKMKPILEENKAFFMESSVSSDISDLSSISSIQQFPVNIVEDDSQTVSKAIPFWRTIMIPGLIEYTLSGCCVSFLSCSLVLWMPYMIRVTDNSSSQNDVLFSNFLAIFFDLGGFFGKLIIGLISDIINSRSIVACVSLSILAPLLLIFSHIQSYHLSIMLLLIFFYGFIIGGLYTLILSSVALDLSTHETLGSNIKAKGTIFGIMTGVSGLVGSFGPLAVGYVSLYGWDSALYLLVAISIIGALCVSRLALKDLYKAIKGLDICGKTYVYVV